jgi:hypothetical protein
MTNGIVGVIPVVSLVLTPQRILGKHSPQEGGSEGLPLQEFYLRAGLKTAMRPSTDREQHFSEILSYTPQCEGSMV